MSIRYCLSVMSIMLLSLMLSSLAIASPRPGDEVDDIVNSETFYPWWSKTKEDINREEETQKEVTKIHKEAMKEKEKRVAHIVTRLRIELSDIIRRGKTCVTLKTSVPPSLPLNIEIQHYLAERVASITDDYKITDLGEINTTMLWLLFHSSQPSSTGIQNPYVAYTKKPRKIRGKQGLYKFSAELDLARLVRSSKKNLMPADLLRMALKVTRGDYPAAMLTCHNFLKEITWAERNRQPAIFMEISLPKKNTKKKNIRLSNKLKDTVGENFGVYLDRLGSGDNKWFSKLRVRDDGELSTKFHNLRLKGDRNYQDKMGPWYHMFGSLLVSSVSMGGSVTAESMTRAEELFREMPFFSSSPDEFKTYLSNFAARRSYNNHRDIRNQANKKKCDNTPQPMKAFKRLTHAKQLSTLKSLGAKNTESLFNCVCQGTGSIQTKRFYRPDGPCWVVGYGESRHPFPSKPQRWEDCMSGNKVNTTIGKDGKVDPDSGVRFDEFLLKAIKSIKMQSK